MLGPLAQNAKETYLAWRQRNADEMAARWATIRAGMKLDATPEQRRPARHLMGEEAGAIALGSIGPAEALTGLASDAERMGFGGHTWYHGTASDIRAIDSANYGTVTRSSFSRSGFMVTRDPAVAGDFADLAAAAPSATAGPNIMPLRIGMRNHVTMDLEGRAMSNTELRQNLEEAIAYAETKKGGKPDAVIFRNMPTKAGAGPVRASDVAVVLDPTRIRSVFARFDPAKAQSTDLLAGLAAAGLIVPMADAAGDGDAATAAATAR